MKKIVVFLLTITFYLVGMFATFNFLKNDELNLLSILSFVGMTVFVTIPVYEHWKKFLSKQINKD